MIILAWTCLLSCVSLVEVSSELEVVCDQYCGMAGKDPLSPRARVFMTEEEALFHEHEYGDSQ